MARNYCILPLLLSLFACGILNAQIKTIDGKAVSTSDVESFLPQLMKDAGVPGLSLAVIRDSKIVYSQGFGVRNLDTAEPVNEETVFEAGSLSNPLSLTRS